MRHEHPAYSVRDISHDYEYPAFDVVHCDPETWHCSYLDDSFWSTREEAEQDAKELNEGKPQPAMTSLETRP